MAYNCVLMDFDETLVSFSKSETESITRVYEKFGIPVTQDNIDYYREMSAGLWSDLEAGKIKKSYIEKNRFRIVAEHFGLKNVKPDALSREYMNCLKNSAYLFDGALEFLQDIEDAVTIAIVTNGIESIQTNRLKISGVMDYIDGVYTSEKLGYTKPDRRIYLSALKDLGVENPRKTLVVGDGLTSDIKGGLSAGLDTCWVNFAEIENTTNIKPKFTVYDYSQLEQVILGEKFRATADI